MDRIGRKLGQTRLGWCDHVKRRDADELCGQISYGDAVVRTKETGKTKEEVF